MIVVLVNEADIDNTITFCLLKAEYYFIIKIEQSFIQDMKKQLSY